MKKGIYLLPSIFTSLSLFCAFYSITASIKGSILHACWAIIIAGVFDGLDGRIARLTGSTSRFGEEYDSLVDMISFGIAPAILVYNWALQPYGRWGWLVAFLYIICTALRLARFNVQSESRENKYFQGLPTPGAAGMIATTVIIFNNLGMPVIKNVTIPLITILFLGEPEIFLFITGVIYTISGPVGFFIMKRKRRILKQELKETNNYNNISKL